MDLLKCSELFKNDSLSFNTKVDFSTCDLEVILSDLGVSVSDSVTTTLGTHQVRTVYWTIHRKDGCVLKIWSQNNSLVKIDVIRDFNDQEEMNQFQTEHGEPTATLDYYFDVIKMKKKTAVYAEHGIALFYGMSDSAIYSWSYFAPMTASNYEETLHPVNPPREFEKR